MDKKAGKFLKGLCLLAVEKVKDHYLVAQGTGYQIQTAGPFLKAVDDVKYPDYKMIITEPMDLAKIDRKLKSDKYIGNKLLGGSTFISAFLADIEFQKKKGHFCPKFQ